MNPNHEPVNLDQRTLSGWNYFHLWAGAGIALTSIWSGGLLAPLGLAGGLMAILLGHLIGNTPLGLAGYIGSRLGVPSMISVRAALGTRGASIAAGLNVLQLLGWTAVMLWIGGQAAARLAGQGSLFANAALWTIICGALTTLWALGGQSLWKRLQAVATILLIALSIVMTYLVYRQYGWGALMRREATGGLAPMHALDLVIAMPMSWVPLAADYARFAKRSASCFAGTWIGFLAGSGWMYVVGLMTSVATGSATPETMVLDLMSTMGLLTAALLIILVSTFTTTFLDIYSNAVSVLAIAPNLPSRAVVIVTGILGTALALVVNAMLYEPFLLMIGSAFCPLFGVVLADFFLVRRRTLDPDALYDGRSFRYTGGFHIAGIAAWILGIAAYHAIRAFAPDFGASLPSLVLAGLAYFGIARRTTPTGAPV